MRLRGQTRRPSGARSKTWLLPPASSWSRFRRMLRHAIARSKWPGRSSARACALAAEAKCDSWTSVDFDSLLASETLGQTRTMTQRLTHYLPLAGLLVLVPAVWVLIRFARDVDVADILAQLQGYSPARVLLAIGCSLLALTLAGL